MGVGKLILFLGKIMIVLLTTGVSGLILLNVDKYKEELSSVLLPCVLIAIMAYCLSTVMMSVFDAAIDTIFMCFLVDEKFNKSGNLHASPKFLELINSPAVKDASQKYAEDEKARRKRVNGGSGDVAMQGKVG